MGGREKRTVMTEDGIVRAHGSPGDSKSTVLGGRQILLGAS